MRRLQREPRFIWRDWEAWQWRPLGLNVGEEMGSRMRWVRMMPINGVGYDVSHSFYVASVKRKGGVKEEET